MCQWYKPRDDSPCRKLARQGAVLNGFVTATTTSGGASVDVSMSALQSVTAGSGATRQISVPLQTSQATLVSPVIVSTGLISITTNTNCPAGSPAAANCEEYTLVVPGSNPECWSLFCFRSHLAHRRWGTLFSVDSRAAQPMSGGLADCTPAELTTSKDDNGQPLKGTAGSQTNVARLDFNGCS
jgi:hypothetical protein